MASNARMKMTVTVCTLSFSVAIVAKNVMASRDSKKIAKE
jgi:hypothetical protein